MDYQEARAAFFQPRPADAPPARTQHWQTPARRLRDAIEPVATICFWAEPAYEAYRSRGLDFLQGYVWGRACVLGEPEPAVVAAAFGGFEPGLIAELYASGRDTCSLGDMRAAKEAGAVAALEQAMDTPDDLERTVDLLERGVDAIPTTAGRAFAAGASSRDRPDDPLGRLWHACTVLREYRGDGHVAAYVVAGLDGLEANIVTELQVGWDPLSYTATRGWSSEAMEAAVGRLAARGLIAGDRLTESGTDLRDGLERTTDLLVQPVIDVLGAELDGLVTTLNQWSQRIIDRGWFPPDPYKRESG